MPGLLSHLIQRMLSPESSLRPVLPSPFGGAASEEPPRPSLERGEVLWRAPLPSASPAEPQAAPPLSGSIGAEPSASRADEVDGRSLSMPSLAEHESPRGEPAHRSQDQRPSAVARVTPTTHAGVDVARGDATRLELEKPRDEIPPPPQELLGERLDALEVELLGLRRARGGTQEPAEALDGADATRASLAPAARPRDVYPPLERLSTAESSPASHTRTESPFRERAPLLVEPTRARRRESDDTAPRSRPSGLLEAGPLLRLSPAPSVTLAGPASPPAAAEHTIHISIGRVELRAAPSPPARAASSQALPQPQLSLARYLDQRHGGRR